MKHNTTTINVANKALYTEIFIPESPKAVVVLVHGMGEHIGRYVESVIPELLKHDIAVVGYDQIGHGKTKSKRGHVKNYDTLLDSLEAVVDSAKTEFPNLPLFLYGHSMGGNVAINYVLRRQPDIRGVVLTSPLLRLAFNPPQWKVSLGRLMLNIFPSITLPSEIDTSAISSEANEVKRYENDAMVHDKISPMYSFPVFDAGEWAIKNANTLPVPALVCHGTGDTITSFKASQEFTNNSENAMLQLFEGGYHELHHDTCKNELLSTVTGWITSKI